MSKELVPMEVRGRPLHFGVQLQAQRSSWADYAAAVKAVEQLGYGSVWNFDHMLPFAGADDGPCFETLTTLSAMALLTERVRIGSLVNGVLYRDPATLAKAAAQVDQMSGGRLDFSLGAAWAEREFKAYGIDFPPLSERHARLDEALEIVKLLWSQPRATFHGRYYHVEDAPCEPKPVQSPHPPITIGGMGLATVRLAAKHADRFNMIGSPDKCADRIQKLEGYCADIGRGPAEIEFSLHPNVAVAASRHEAEALAARVAAANAVDLQANRASWVIGDPAEVTAALRSYIDLGINHFVFGVGHPFDMTFLRLLREEVLVALG
jgi:F420-dependent oxidoreductase-like protein